MKIELEEKHWVNGKADAINIILSSKYQIIQAEMAIKRCDEEIAKLPKDLNKVKK